MRGYPILPVIALSLVIPFTHAASDSQTVLQQTLPAVSYDYIIAGGGVSGLVVANRLSEDPQKTVLVIEHGYFDDQDPDVLVPGLARMNLGVTNAKHMFNYTTTPQSGLNNRTAHIWAATVVGGGSAVNGMVFPRGAAADYDAWAQLGNPGWSWDDILPYFRKSETFTMPPKGVAEEFSIKYNASAHGTEGPIYSSYPKFLWPSMKNFFRAWEELDVSISQDGNDGNAIGAYWMPNSLHPRNQSRSYARPRYYDNIRSRSNLHLVTGHVVDRVLFNDDLKAVGVKVISRDGSFAGVAYATREVILASGTVHSPGILQRSGIGAREHVNSLGIETVVDLPGVGQNLQDHPALHFVFEFREDLNPNPLMLSDPKYAAEQLALYYKNRTGLFTNNRGIALAMLPLRNVTTDYEAIVRELKNTDPVAHLPPDVDSTVLEGFKAQREILIEHLESCHASAMEITYEGRAEFDAALQKPLSRGTLLIDSTDPLSAPLIDYRVYSHPTDMRVAIAVVRAARSFMLSAAMQKLGATEISPGPAVLSDEDIEAAIQSRIGEPTFGHISGTCAMQPRRLGGVVDERLAVYGVKGLRVVDASIMPLVSTTHLQATVYAIAEKVGLF
ncbi:GMC oxidoreductase [Laetiporus sulphureus 93-53]|uniref:GMC oxidoreductase n=1 Tax=Laetiporus sulphureus 93-53 TaxID=1314785 RepID=A0A165DHH2_9APHY|nr:GMC oxidoreductase [Laetiporus sulphureus 93-53]KZT04890.1 GMC oxidoreductase [Laetiporus sulphureus 93-53]